MIKESYYVVVNRDFWDLKVKLFFNFKIVFCEDGKILNKL